MGTNVIGKGVKFFWRTRNTIDIMLVEHSDQFTTEIVTYDPTIDREAPRLYIDSNLLYSKLDHVDIAAQLRFGQRNGVAITEEIIANKAKFDYIVGRLVISEYRTDLRILKMELQFSNEDTYLFNMSCSKPEALIPFRSPHFHTLMEGVVEQTMRDLRNEHIGLKKEIEAAQALEDIVHKALNIRERWRIPMVFIKVSKNRRLSAADSAIWQKVTSNMKNEEDAAVMAAALAPPVPAAAADVANKKAPAAVAYVSTTLPGTKVFRSNNRSPKQPSLQRGSSRMRLESFRGQRSQAKLSVNDEDAPAPLKPSPSNSKLLTRAASNRGSSISCSPSSAATPTQRARAAPKHSRSTPRDSAAEVTTKYNALEQPAAQPDADGETEAETTVHGTIYSALSTMAQSVKTSIGLSAKNKVQPAEDTDASADYAEDAEIGIWGGEKSAFTTHSTALNSPTSLSVDGDGENPADLTPVNAAPPICTTAKPVPSIARQQKRSSFIQFLLQGLSFNSPTSSFSSPAYGHSEDVAMPGAGNPSASSKYQSNFPLVQMVLAGMRPTRGPADSVSAKGTL